MEPESKVNVVTEMSTANRMLLDEVADRLVADLDERDNFAVSTAVQKALFRGFKLGASVVADELGRVVITHWDEIASRRDTLEAVLLPIVLSDEDLTEVDPWAELYGALEDD